MEIHQSGEDYLESILKLREEGKSVRSIDVAMELAVSKPSVSIAMKKLRESGYVAVEDGVIVLTEEGEAIARKTLNRHRILKDFFLRLGVSEAVAEEDACKVEHDLSEETFQKLVEHAQNHNKT